MTPHFLAMGSGVGRYTDREDDSSQEDGPEQFIPFQVAVRKTRVEECC